MKKLKWILMILVLTSVLAIATCFMIFNGVTRNIGKATATFTGSLDTEVDNVRAMYDLDALNETAELDTIAKEKCTDMVNRHYFAHQDPEGQYIWQEYPFTYNTAGENLAWGYNDAQSTADAWLNSKIHKDNMLNPKYTEVGYAVCLDQDHYKIIQLLKG